LFAGSRDPKRSRLGPGKASGVRDASGDLLAAALHSEISEAWRLMHKWRAKAAAHQATGETAYV
jgi:hypothetical protein